LTSAESGTTDELVPEPLVADAAVEDVAAVPAGCADELLELDEPQPAAIAANNDAATRSLAARAIAGMLQS
jgi:hypothetical protein